MKRKTGERQLRRNIQLIGTIKTLKIQPCNQLSKSRLRVNPTKTRSNFFRANPTPVHGEKVVHGDEGRSSLDVGCSMFDVPPIDQSQDLSPRSFHETTKHRL